MNLKWWGKKKPALILTFSRFQERRNRLVALLVWLIKRAGEPVFN
jgi:hypothetical protein